MFCKECGFEIPDGARFCSMCGAPVVTDDVDEGVSERSFAEDSGAMGRDGDSDALIVCAECRAASQVSADPTCPNCFSRLNPSAWGYESAEEFLEWQGRLRSMTHLPPISEDEALRLREWLANIRTLPADPAADADDSATVRRASYRALRTVAFLYRLAGWVLLFLLAVLVIIVFVNYVLGDTTEAAGWVRGVALAAVPLLALGALTCLAAGELLILAVAVADDTRRTSGLAAELVGALTRDRELS